MRRRDLRRKCDELLATIGLVPGFAGQVTAADVGDRLGQLRDRKIYLLPVRTRPSSPTGMWFATVTADYIFHVDPAQTSPVHAMHCILHEAGHMMLGHTGTPNLWPHVAELSQALSTDATTSVMLRNCFSTECELEAEVFATVGCGYIGDVRAATRVRDPGGNEVLFARLSSDLSDAYPNGGH